MTYSSVLTRGARDVAMRKDRHDGASYRRLELITGSKRRTERHRLLAGDVLLGHVGRTHERISKPNEQNGEHREPHERGSCNGVCPRLENLRHDVPAPAQARPCPWSDFVMASPARRNAV